MGILADMTALRERESNEQVRRNEHLLSGGRHIAELVTGSG
jgi:hypothetical protein